jgi:hypothetical protein
MDLRRGTHLPGARQLLTIHLLSRRHLIAQAGKPGEDNGVCAAQLDRCQSERWKDPSDGCSHDVALIGHLSCPVRAGDIRDNGVVSGARPVQTGLVSWERIGVDFSTAQGELEQQSPGLYITVSQRAYTIVCSPARTLTIHYTSGGEVEVPPEERELVRARLEAALDADWPSYIVEALAGAQLAT